ncbi:unnamed protein product [Paramecium sonneborni]|uniref:MORN repeat protein n=1 Tax=Paramecium sonneborni TaxID=65129 RepID=A0A8S1RKA5_9CILI|nr:unnamed protein product [Paramecium sonneborni]
MGNCSAENIQYYENVEFTEGDTYEGEMKNGFAEGWGIYTRKNGDKYIGWWHNGFQHGIGKEIFADKTEYEGTFEEGKKHGQGKIKFPDGSSYEGQFQKDSFSGDGVYIYPNGMKLFGRIVFQLSLVSGQIIEKKVEHKQYLRMEIYFNQYKNDMKNGEGLFKCPDGCRFESNWVDGQLQGESKYIENDILTIGEWLNNRCVKWEQQND